MKPPRLLADAEIDHVVAALRTTPGDHVRRGRAGDGYAFRDGRFFRLSVDEDQAWETPFADEADFRAHLAAIDVDDWIANRYRRAVFEALGVRL